MLDYFQLVIIPIIIGLVEVLKRAGLSNTFSPLVSVFLGLVFGILYIDPFLDGIVVGLVIGLSATGLYSGSKNMFRKSSKKTEDKM
ncbi:hypothetical protein [Niallia sp. Krafla_26]|uniref:hypothetical protein n=1 Tax=Niallia sp. Krafla_26 TaxID=3064703 RepID=UPI003D185AF2